MNTILWREDLEIDPIDPDEDYLLPIDWSDRLGSDTIASATVSAEAGITAAVDSFTTTVTNIRVNTGTGGAYPKVSVKIVTATPQTFERSFIIPVRNL